MRHSHSDPEVEAYISKAGRDLATAKHMAEKGSDFADVICFHAEQCAEKSLKALLLASGRLPPRTHDLVLIHRTIVEIAPHMADLEPHCLQLTDYAVAPRYPGWEDVAGSVDMLGVIESARTILERSIEELGLRVSP